MKNSLLVVFVICFGLVLNVDVLSAKQQKELSMELIINQKGPNYWDQADFKAWEKELYDWWVSENKQTLTEKIDNLAWLVIRPSVPLDSNTRIYAYNILRGLLNRKPIRFFSEIDAAWFENVAKELHQIYWIENVKKDRLFLPSIAQEELVRNAQLITGLVEPCAILSHSSARSSFFGIAAGQTADLDESVFSTYHELGHIQFGDVQEATYINNVQMLVFSGEQYKQGQLIQNFGADHPMLNSHLKMVERYVELAKIRLSDESETGRIIREKIVTTPLFWNAPQEDLYYINTAIGRGQESRADLFAVQTLLQQKNLKTILFGIRKFGTADYHVVKGTADVHPSHLERSLYMAGFLFSQGIDVNKELRTWERAGTCTDVRTLYGPWSNLHQKTMGDLMRIYKDQEAGKLAAEYALWKNERDNELKNNNVDEAFFVSLVQLFYKLLQANPEDKETQKRILFNYNYLREKNNMPIADMLGQVDRSWLENKCRSTEISGLATKSCAACCVSKGDVGCVCEENDNALKYSTAPAGCQSYSNNDGTLICDDIE